MFEKRKDWAISSQASSETVMKVQRLLKFPKGSLRKENMEKVNCAVR